jgi:hypothetical protein
VGTVVLYRWIRKHLWVFDWAPRLVVSVFAGGRANGCLQYCDSGMCRCRGLASCLCTWCDEWVCRKQHVTACAAAAAAAAAATAAAAAETPGVGEDSVPSPLKGTDPENTEIMVRHWNVSTVDHQLTGDLLRGICKRMHACMLLCAGVCMRHAPAVWPHPTCTSHTKLTIAVMFPGQLSVHLRQLCSPSPPLPCINHR